MSLARRLLDPFQSVELPEVIEEFLEQGTATCVAFNRRGTLLAGELLQLPDRVWRSALGPVRATLPVLLPNNNREQHVWRHEAAAAPPGPLHDAAPCAAGTQESQVVVWDFDTRGVARSLNGHKWVWCGGRPTCCCCCCCWLADCIQSMRSRQVASSEGSATITPCQAHLHLSNASSEIEQPCIQCHALRCVTPALNLGVPSLLAGRP